MKVKNSISRILDTMCGTPSFDTEKNVARDTKGIYEAFASVAPETAKAYARINKLK